MSSNDGKHAPIKSEVQGNATGGAHWDDGPNYNGIRKVYVTCTYEKTHLRSMDIDYDKNGQVETIRHGMKNGETQEFVVDFPNEYLTSVEGTYNHVHEGNYLALTSLTFKTSKGRSSQTFGLVTGTKFVFESLGNVITGFHGSCGGSFDSLGVYFSPMLPALPPSGINSGGAALIKSEVQGNATGGAHWDDGPHYNGIRKVYVTRTYEKTHLRSMDIDYDKNGQVETIRHGMKNGETEEFSVDFPNEYITSVEGTYNHVHEGNYLVLTSLTFKTSKGRSSQTFGLVTGTKFVFERPGSVIIGFHGSCGGSFDSLGVYFSPNSEGAAASGGSSSGGTSTDSSPQKVEAQGGNGGNQWDDGSEHDGVTKIHVAVGGLGIELIKFDYLKNGQPKEGPSHGVKGVRVVVETIEIDHPNEYLISVEGWYSNDMIEGIQFKTNTRTIQYFGYQEGKHFSLEVKDKKIVGFHGFSDSRLNSIGAYFAPIATTITPLKPAKKLNAIGGNGGASWDDGAFDGVQKIFVGQGNDGVAFLMFEYNKGSQVILGDGRGKKTALGTETFELDYPSEYIISVEGYYDKLYGVEAEVVTSLTFKTNKRTSPPFGLTAGEHFEFKDEGNKIVGFHGKAGDYVHQIGVYVAPITTN